VESDAIISVSAAVVMLVSLIKWAGLPDKWGPVAVLVISAAGVAFWCWSGDVYSRSLAWDLGTGWITVAATAAGVYGFTRKSGEILTRFKE
jgi:hypothetical protein